MSPIEYTVIRSNRKTAAIQIRNGAVIIRCPYGTKDAWIERFVQSRASWIQAHLTKPVLNKFSPEELARLKALAGNWFPKRVAQLSGITGLPYNHITIRSQHSRWGSCSSKGNLNFNCLLMLTPEQIRDYVIIHELCHRKHMNHSRQFWSLVESYLPNYRESLRWLKTEGSALIRRLPD